ncbi:unnamed protein product, partial [Ixodes persulcatus]
KVSRKLSTKELKSDCLCLIVLPCPGVLCDCIAGCFDSFCFLILLLSGDVELNPGPTVDEQLAQIIESQKENSKELKSIQGKLDSHISETDKRLTSIEEKLESFSRTVERVDDCEHAVNNLNHQVATLMSKIDDLENRSRRNNLIVYGVNERETETPNSLREFVLTGIFEEKLGVKVSSLERIHRLGKKTPNKTRPVILRLFDFNEKMELLRNAKKFKETKISVSEDFSLKVQNIRKQLWATVKDKRKPEDKVYLKYDKLIINQDVYVWDDENCR